MLEKSTFWVPATTEVTEPVSEPAVASVNVSVSVNEPAIGVFENGAVPLDRSSVPRFAAYPLAVATASPAANAKWVNLIVSPVACGLCW